MPYKVLNGRFVYMMNSLILAEGYSAIEKNIILTRFLPLPLF